MENLRMSMEVLGENEMLQVVGGKTITTTTTTTVDGVTITTTTTVTVQ